MRRPTSEIILKRENGTGVWRRRELQLAREHRQLTEHLITRLALLATQQDRAGHRKAQPDASDPEALAKWMAEAASTRSALERPGVTVRDASEVLIAGYRVSDDGERLDVVAYGETSSWIRDRRWASRRRTGVRYSAYPPHELTSESIQALGAALIDLEPNSESLNVKTLDRQPDGSVSF